MIEANKATEITEQAYIKKRDKLLQFIDATILKYAEEGKSSCSIDDSEFFDDTVEQELTTAGYHLRYINADWGGFYKISWSDNKC